MHAGIRSRFSQSVLVPVVLATLAGASTAPSPVRADAGWSSTGDLTQARRAHSATLLPNGLVLVAGGSIRGTYVDVPLASAELYDSSTGIWTQTGSLNVARYGQAATLLGNGRVLVVGGFTAYGLGNTAEIYDPDTGVWGLTGSTTYPHFDAPASLLEDGRVLVAGGRTAAAEIFDPGTETWTLTGSMHVSREAHTTTVLNDGRVLVTGGSYFDPNCQVEPCSDVYKSTEIYDPGSGRFALAADMAAVRAQHRAVLLQDGRVLVAGGYTGILLGSSEVYDPGTGTWTSTGQLVHRRAIFTMTLLDSGQVLAAGGGIYAPSLEIAELYDPSAGTWSETASLGTARNAHTATKLPDGRVLGPSR